MRTRRAHWPDLHAECNESAFVRQTNSKDSGWNSQKPHTSTNVQFRGHEDFRRRKGPRMARLKVESANRAHDVQTQRSRRGRGRNQKEMKAEKLGAEK
jgi:hypothetical protein